MNLLVAGAGPAGLAAALGFANLGYTVDVLEKHEEFAVRGSTLGLQENGVKALRHFCPDDKVDSLFNLGVTKSADTVQNTGATMLAWWTLHEWLLEQVEECPSITMHMGNTVDTIDDDESDNFIRVQCKEGGSFQGDLLVAADGVHSRVRSLLGLSSCKFTGNTIWRGSVIVDDTDEPLLQALLENGFAPVPFENYGGHTSFFVFNHHPKLHKRLNWIVNSRATNIKPEKTTPWDLFEPHTRTNEMRDTIKAVLDHSEPHELTHSMKLSTTELPAATDNGWGGRGRVTLIGDAAHAIRPTAGQGTSLAFEDVAVLCRKVQENRPTKRDEWEQTIREFENERLPRVKRIAEEQIRLAEAMTGGDMSGSNEKYMEWVAQGV